MVWPLPGLLGASKIVKWLSEGIDNLKTAGVYFLNGTNSAAAATDDAILLVYSAKNPSVSNSQICAQIKFPKGFPVVIFRTYSAATDRWSAWIEFGS